MQTRDESTALASKPEFDHYMSIDQLNAVANTPRWTVSSSDKVPLDIVDVMRNNADPHGAIHPDERSLTTRPELMAFFADRPFTENGMIETNHTFRINAKARDPFIVIDVEPTCPAELQRAMIDNLPWVYCERSSSGRGWHLVVPTPWPNALDDGYLTLLHEAGRLDDAAMSKRVEHLWNEIAVRPKIRVSDGSYEILCEHFITFTQRCGEHMQHRTPTIEQYEFLETFLDRTIANAPRPTQHRTTYRDANGIEHEITVEAERPEHVMFDECVAAAIEAFSDRPYEKEPQDFDNDMSRWEFGFINTLIMMARSAIEDTLRTDDIHDPFITMDENTYVWVIYEAVVACIPHREKHEGSRENLPYLLSRTKAAFAAHVDEIDPRIWGHSLA